MTVNELYGTWLHNGNPNADLLVWDRNEGEYIFSLKNPIPNQNVDKVAQMEVGCFFCSYNKETDTETLTVNVGEFDK